MEGFIEANVIPQKAEMVKPKREPIVLAQGVCWNLDGVKINQLTLEETTKQLNVGLPQEQKLVNDTSDKISQLRSALKDVLENKTLQKILIDKDKDQLINRDEIKKALDITNKPIIDRLFFLLNYNLDPEIIPLILASSNDNTINSTKFADILKGNEFLRLSMADLLVDENYRDQTFGIKFGNQKSYSQPTADKLLGIVNSSCLEMQQKYPASTTQEIHDFRTYLINFLILDGRKNKVPSLDFEEKCKSFSTALYFLVKYHEKVNGKPLYKWRLGIGEYSTVSPIREKLIARAKDFETSDYVQKVYETGKAIYSSFFPEVYTDPEIQYLFMTDQGSRSHREEGELSWCGAPGMFDPKLRLIELGTQTILKKGHADTIPAQKTRSAYGVEIKRILDDVLLMVHELSHAVYQKRVRKNWEDLPAGYRNTVDLSLNEGFATLMQRLAMDVIKDNPHVLALDENDIVDIEKYKQSRMDSLREAKNRFNPYQEGFTVFHRIYSESSGSEENPNMHERLTAILKFLDSLDPDKTIKTQRTNPEYIKSLQEEDIAEWNNLFCVTTTAA